MNGDVFGEVDENNRLHGRGIRIYNNAGNIYIGYYERGHLSTGNYIRIWRNGRFEVRERYRKDGKIWNRGTLYYKNGKEEKSDHSLF